MPAPTLQFKRGLFTNLPGLKAGEPGFTTDFFELYVGIDSTTNNNKFLGSHRYWTKGTASTGSGVNFVEGTSNGSDFITLKAPDTLAGIVTFTLPLTDGSDGDVLRTNGSGALSFVGSTFTISNGSGSTDSVGLGQTLTFAGTANEIETAVTDNQVQIGLPGAVSITTSVVVGSGVTINASGIVASAGIVTASKFVSNVLSGEPISVASSTRVDNLNATYIGGLAAPTSAVVGSGDTQTLTNKTIALGSNTISGTLAEFNNALTDADFVSIAGTETLSNKTLLVGTSTATGTASQPLQVEGGAYVSGTLGIGTTNPDQTFKLVVQGSANFIGSVTSATGFFVNGNLVGGGSISGTSLVGTALSISGISTFSGGPVLIGGGTSTGTTGQVLQVAGINSSVYIGGNLGVGVTNPQATLQVGTAISMYGATGIVSATTFVGALTGTATSTTNIPNLTGAITSVNTTTSLGSFSSSDLAGALTDETGSGAAVFATSPTLVTPTLGIAAATDLNVSGITTTGTLKLSGTSGIGITGISSSTTLVENSHAYLPTQAAVKAYVDAVDVTLGINADTGGPSTVATSQTLTVSGTANEVNTSVSGQTITVGLPDSVTVTTALTTPTVNVTNLKANDGTTAITITNSTGAVGINSNLTVLGDLFVNGTTTQINTNSLTVEDRTIDLGIVSGAAPSSDTTWDLGILFNYHATTAKKSAVIWEHGDSRFKFASVLAADTVGIDSTTPQLTVTTFAPIEIASLFVNDCAGASQVISCTGTERFLENITVDAGSF